PRVPKAPHCKVVTIASSGTEAIRKPFLPWAIRSSKSLFTLCATPSPITNLARTISTPDTVSVLCVVMSVNSRHSATVLLWNRQLSGVLKHHFLSSPDDLRCFVLPGNSGGHRLQLQQPK